MIEIKAKIEDLIFDPVTKKYRVDGNHTINPKTNSKAKSSKKKYTHPDSITFKIKFQKLNTTQNLIEKKGLHVDFIVK